MARILSIDYGAKRTGLAVTDPLQIIATGLATVETVNVLVYLKKYFAEEMVETIIIGDPKNLNNTATHATPLVEKFIQILTVNFPGIPIVKIDERFTSSMARQAMLDMGMKKKARRNKAIVDEIAATIMLQQYLMSGH